MPFTTYHVPRSSELYGYNQAENDWEDLLAIGMKETKLAFSQNEAINAIFKLFSLGVITTNRDEWVYDFNRFKLQKVR
ncbi:MAG: hypothetical protein R2865_00980 [Deinococcales bacterium]